MNRARRLQAEDINRLLREPMPSHQETQVRVCKLRLRNQGQEALEWILAQPNCSIDCVFYAAAELNMVETMEYLFREREARISAFVAFDGFQRSILGGAVSEGSVSAIRWLLDHGADVHSGAVSARMGSYPPVWEASQNGHLRVVRILLEAGADPNAVKSNTGYSALLIACQYGQDVVAGELIRWGANPVAGVHASTPLSNAIAFCNLDLVALLCSVGATVDAVVYLQCIHGMTQNWMTQVGSKLQKSISPKDIAYLFGMVQPDGRNAASVLNDLPVIGMHYNKSRQAEQKGEYREALRHISAAQSAYQRLVGEPPLGMNRLGKKVEEIHAFCESSLKLWPQLLLDGQRMYRSVYGPAACDGRLAIWNEHAFDRNTVMFPPDLQFYSWSRHENTIYRYGGKKFLVSLLLYLVAMPTYLCCAIAQIGCL